MRQRFHQWLASLDPAVREVIRESERTWLAVGVIAFGLVAVAALSPGPREFFQLRFWPALLCGLPAILTPLVFTAVDRRRGLRPVPFGLLYLTVTALLLFFAAALVAFSSLPGSSIFGAIFFLMASFYGHHQRASRTYPYSLIVTGLALAGAWALNPTPANSAIFAVLAPASLGGSFVLGTLALAREGERSRMDALRAAVDAQILREQTTDLSRLSDTILKILERNHDASNALSAALFNAESLLGSTGPAGVPTPREVHPVVKDLHQNLLRLQDLVEHTRNLGRREGAEIASLSGVCVVPVLETVLERLRGRFPRVEILGPLLDAADPRVEVLMSGGEHSLERVCENVVLNACEGDTRGGAARVSVRLRSESDVSAVAIEVCDDGPGFSPDQLEEGIRGFRTAKRGGTGLGLYTAERLIRASGGSIELGTSRAGGARVSIYLTEHVLA